MTDSEAVTLINEWVKKEWIFEIIVVPQKNSSENWRCNVIGKGMAEGRGYGTTLAQAVERAFQLASLMEDDPMAIIKKHGCTIARIAKEVFGEKAFAGLEPVQWEPMEPIRICLLINGHSDPSKQTDLEFKFSERAALELPLEVREAIRMELN